MSEAPAIPVAKRRWFSISLRTFFAILTAFCLWLGWNANLVQRRNQVRHYVRLDREAGIPWDISFVPTVAIEPLPKSPTRQEERKHYFSQRRHRSHVQIMKNSTAPVSSRNLSWIRKQLGDEPVDLILVFKQTDHDLLRSLFPEAHIFMMPPRKNTPYRIVE